MTDKQFEALAQLLRLRAEPQHASIWRTFAVRCARRVHHLMTDERSLQALDVAERHARGLATDEGLDAAWDAVWATSWDAAWVAARGAAWGVVRTGGLVGGDHIVTRAPQWTAEEVAILAAHNGSPHEAMIALARAGYKRSASSVATKMQKLRASGRIEQTHQSRVYGVLSAKIEAALERRGAMTRDELCKLTGQERHIVVAVLKRLRDTGRVHISEWRRHAPGQREYPRPVYAAGPGIDAKRPPKVGHKEANRRYRKIRGVGVRSVFDLGRVINRASR